ncbi:(6-4)DNA photolyase [Cymbomonas tetramitiformis]|uniref:(6-4)DNA photolyase n=1 Tax=Cymbomonas tetramitiformis TaxID=36881 RepID=A0AAE0H256_9CHLO|nr:(6-4)DNA photolyase [Cymbomonas tetramitiformis]
MCLEAKIFTRNEYEKSTSGWYVCRVLATKGGYAFCRRKKPRTFTLSAQMSAESTLLWFRKGLRLHDNPALEAACKNAKHVHPVFIIDPWFMNPDKISGVRIKFLLESLEDLDSSLRGLNSKLHVMLGKPDEVLPKLFEQWNVKRICYEYDTEPYAVSRDERIKELAAEAGVEVISPVSHTLYDIDWLIQKAGGKAPLTYQSFTKLVDQVGPPPAALPPPTALPPPKSDALRLAAEAGLPGDGCVPSLTTLGYSELADGIGFPFTGGETTGLQQMHKHLSRKAWVAKFEKPMTAPTDFDPAATTQLSPYLKFG